MSWRGSSASKTACSPRSKARRVYAIADEDLDRENDEKTSAVHFLRFEFNAAQRDAVRAGAAVKLGCDHTQYPAHVDIAADTLASLAGDLRA